MSILLTIKRNDYERSLRFCACLRYIVRLYGNCRCTVQSSEKDVKKRVKELTKEGWKPLASSSTLEYAFPSTARIWRKIRKPHRAGRYCHRQECKIGRENAIMNGITSYASRAKAQVVGKMKGLMSSEASSTPEEEIDKFGAAYESGVNTKIAGLVKQHLVLVKENKDGSKEFNVYMSIDEAKAKKAREEAALAAKTGGFGRTLPASGGVYRRTGRG